PQVPDHHRTDLGNARRLVEEHGLDLRYCYAWDKWLVWDGIRWQMDQSGEVHRRAKQTVGKMYEEAQGKVGRLKKELEPLPAKDPRREQLSRELKEAESGLKHAQRSESAARLEAMLTVAQSEPGVPVRPE